MSDPLAPIGPYRPLELLGEGGMGEVWLAEQSEPVKRQVALKIIKLGMDTKQVVARFEAERQALAVMDHPNIAKVYDGGATPEGRPFFVMELVRGRSLTDYADDEKLTTRERIGLFIDVCRAVQHAHQKGVVHRDLKPSNILVVFDAEGPISSIAVSATLIAYPPREARDRASRVRTGDPPKSRLQLSEPRLRVSRLHLYHVLAWLLDPGSWRSSPIL